MSYHVEAVYLLPVEEQWRRARPGGAPVPSLKAVRQAAWALGKLATVQTSAVITAGAIPKLLAALRAGSAPPEGAYPASKAAVAT